MDRRLKQIERTCELPGNMVLKALFPDALPRRTFIRAAETGALPGSGDKIPTGSRNAQALLPLFGISEASLSVFKHFDAFKNYTMLEICIVIDTFIAYVRENR